MRRCKQCTGMVMADYPFKQCPRCNAVDWVELSHSGAVAISRVSEAPRGSVTSPNLYSHPDSPSALVPEPREGDYS